MNFTKYKLHIFIIPYHLFGGAQRVHIEIIKSLKSKPIVLFDHSDNIKLSDEFRDNAFCFFITSPKRKKIATYFINIISIFMPITLFGCNSGFFYHNIRKKRKMVTAIDLTHAFSFPELGVEKISLPYVSFIDKRIVINKRTLEDYKILYKTNHLDSNLLNRFKIISNGVEINEFNPDLINSRFDDFKIGFIGRNSSEKRPILFFKLYELLYKKNIKAKVIGNNFDNVKGKYIDLNVEYFEGCGNPKDIRNKMSDISVLIVSSNREGFPLVIMEAMEFGIPVISTNVGSIYEHVYNDLNGYITDDKSENGFVQWAYDKVLTMSSNRLLYSRMSFSAREYAVDNFGLEKFKEEYIKLFYE